MTSSIYNSLQHPISTSLTTSRNWNKQALHQSWNLEGKLCSLDSCRYRDVKTSFDHAMYWTLSCVESTQQRNRMTTLLHQLKQLNSLKVNILNSYFKGFPAHGNIFNLYFKGLHAKQTPTRITFERFTSHGSTHKNSFAKF